MAGGKRLKGIPFAIRTAVFGMPATLTGEERLFLELNTEIGRAVQTHTVVEGGLIASGRPGPWSYYLMLADGDAREAGKLQARALLAEMMNART